MTTLAPVHGAGLGLRRLARQDPEKALGLLEVYAAGEAPIPGADSRSLARSIRLRGQVEPILIDPVEGNLETLVQKVLQPNDLLLTQGAGNVGAISIELAQNKLYLK